MSESNKWSGKWTESIAVGEELFVKKVKDLLGFRTKGRKIHNSDGAYQLKEPDSSYGSIDVDKDNTYLWDI